jgi:hypothetical protein
LTALSASRDRGGVEEVARELGERRVVGVAMERFEREPDAPAARRAHWCQVPVQRLADQHGTKR